MSAESSSDNGQAILNEAQVLATLAVSYDQQKDYEAAIYFYNVSVDNFIIESVAINVNYSGSGQNT